MRRVTQAISAALLLWAVPTSAAGDQDFTLVNRTGFDIREVYVSPTKAQKWGRDVLGTGMLHDTMQVPIKFKSTNTTCIYDLKVIYTDDDTAEWTEFDLCTISKIKIYYDKKTGEPTAEYS